VGEKAGRPARLRAMPPQGAVGVPFGSAAVEETIEKPPLAVRPSTPCYGWIRVLAPRCCLCRLWTW